MSRQVALTDGSEDFDQFLERFEIVDQAGLCEAGTRLSWAVYAMIKANGIDGGLVTHSILCMILGAHLAREKLL